MNEPLSRFADHNPKPRPTHTLIVPQGFIVLVINALLAAREIFTVEPSPTNTHVWHLGVFQSGVAVVTAAMGPSATLHP